MNVRIATFIDYEGAAEDLKPLISDIADAVLRHGHGNPVGASEDDPVQSMIVAGEVDLNNDNLLELADGALFLVIPVDNREGQESEEGEEDAEGRGTDTEGSEDLRRGRGQDRSPELLVGDDQRQRLEGGP